MTPDNRNNNFADLHVHTNRSDGIFSPEELIENAAREGLKAVAITDHDTVEAVEPCIVFAKEKNIEIIPGVELSARNKSKEVHILGYYINYKDKEFLSLLASLKVQREERMRRMMALLGEKGINIQREKIFKGSSGSVGRLHLARVLKEEGVVNTISEAFDRYIGEGKPCYVEHQRLPYKKAISYILNAGGIPVLAHPGSSCKEETIRLYVDAGLKGIEVYHSRHRQPENKRYLNLAKKYNLLVTGGSDCHGNINPDNMLLGKVRVSREVVEALRKAASKNNDKAGTPFL